VSVWESTQEPLQAVRFAGQPAAQPPWKQTWVAPQMVPQTPQLFGSFCLSTQVPKHWVKPV
jgi:hypothetical protein